MHRSLLLISIGQIAQGVAVGVSRDDGKTWGEAVVIGADDYNETALVRLKSGRWLAAVRTTGDGHLDLFSSNDEGKTSFSIAATIWGWFAGRCPRGKGPHRLSRKAGESRP